jgi:hypothetical protein
MTPSAAIHGDGWRYMRCSAPASIFRARGREFFFSPVREIVRVGQPFCFFASSYGCLFVFLYCEGSAVSRFA